MTDPRDDLPAAADTDDADADAFAEAYDRHRDELYNRVTAYAEEAEIDEGFLAALLMDLTVRMRTVAYYFDVEKPSASGLKLDLDRLQREFGDLVRHTKKDAEAIVQDMKAAEAELEDEDDKAENAGAGDETEPR